MMNLGLTGGIATGKSTVSVMLKRRGAHIIDADQIAREVVLPGSPVLLEVFKAFGQGVQMEDGSLNRKKLSELIFNDPIARTDLEQILHPPIRKRMIDSMSRLETAYPNNLIVVDVPLLFESELSALFSEVMLVYVPEKIQLERLVKRDQITTEEAKKRLLAQMPIEEKRALADIIIDNSGSLEQTEEQINEYTLRNR